MKWHKVLFSAILADVFCRIIGAIVYIIVGSNPGTGALWIVISPAMFVYFGTKEADNKKLAATTLAALYSIICIGKYAYMNATKHKCATEWAIMGAFMIISTIITAYIINTRTDKRKNNG